MKFGGLRHLSPIWVKTTRGWLVSSSDARANNYSAAARTHKRRVENWRESRSKPSVRFNTFIFPSEVQLGSLNFHH
jgi:hypothetical protein